MNATDFGAFWDDDFWLDSLSSWRSSWISSSWTSSVGDIGSWPSCWFIVVSVVGEVERPSCWFIIGASVVGEVESNNSSRRESRGLPAWETPGGVWKGGVWEEGESGGGVLMHEQGLFGGLETAICSESIAWNSIAEVSRDSTVGRDSFCGGLTTAELRCDWLNGKLRGGLTGFEGLEAATNWGGANSVLSIALNLSPTSNISFRIVGSAFQLIRSFTRCDQSLSILTFFHRMPGPEPRRLTAAMNTRRNLGASSYHCNQYTAGGGGVSFKLYDASGGGRTRKSDAKICWVNANYAKSRGVERQKCPLRRRNEQKCPLLSG